MAPGTVVKRRLVALLLALGLSAATHAQPSAAIPATAPTWPDNPRLSGNAFLPPGLLSLQADPVASPIALWLDKGATLWRERHAVTGASCQGCHGDATALRQAVPTYPRLSTDGKTVLNLEDQIVTCRARAGHGGARLESDEVLSLSALLHQSAQGLPIDVRAPTGDPALASAWQARLSQGAQLFATRLGRMNLACVHCHDQSIGRQMRVDVISPGHPTGFPIYRMSWQRLGTTDRRLRACYAGVQAVLPPAGAPELRDLELYLKVRANGMRLDGPSIRR